MCSASDWISAVSAAIQALAIIVGGVVGLGGYFAKEKFNILSGLWFHFSAILDAMKPLADRGKRRSEDQQYSEFIDVLKEHQNNAYDYFRKAELMLDDKFVKQSERVFRLISSIRYEYFNKKEVQQIQNWQQDPDLKEEFNKIFEMKDQILLVRDDLKTLVNNEFEKWRYWLLR